MQVSATQNRYHKELALNVRIVDEEVMCYGAQGSLL